MCNSGRCDNVRYVGLIVRGGYIYLKQDMLNNGSPCLTTSSYEATSNISQGYTELLWSHLEQCWPCRSPDGNQVGTELNCRKRFSWCKVSVNVFGCRHRCLYYTFRTQFYANSVDLFDYPQSCVHRALHSARSCSWQLHAWQTGRCSGSTTRLGRPAKIHTISIKLSSKSVV